MNWLYKSAFPAMNSPVPTISTEEAMRTCVGPFYHGTGYDRIDKILSSGFSWDENEPGDGGLTRNGYGRTNYIGTDCMPPVHHLGYGIYLTQVKSIAKQYGNDSMRNVLEFWIIKSAKIESINFASNNTMMKWWRANGYDCKLADIDRVAATRQLTQNLSSKFDAVLFRGQTIRRVLDGNQICVYNPSVLRRIDKQLNKPGEIGSKVRRKSDGMIGVLNRRRSLTPEQSELYHYGEPELLEVKWRKGGTDMNVYSRDIEFI